MKILYYFAQYDGAMYHWQDVHIIDELAHHGIEIEIFNPLFYMTMEEANEQVLKQIRNNQYDLFMTCNTERYCWISTVEAIKQFGIPTLLICFDSLMTPLAHKKIAPHFDAVMISQKDETGNFCRYNKNTIVSHYAANPYFFTPYYNISKINRISFAGTPYGSRANTIENIIKSGLPVDLYFGNSHAINTNQSASQIVYKEKKSNILFTSMQMLRYPEGRKVLLAAGKDIFSPSPVLDLHAENLSHYDAVDLRSTNMIYASHDLSLSVSFARKTGNLKKPVNIVHLRNFEIPMSAGIQICQYFDELAECFEDNKEIIFYHDYDELLEKAKFYLKPENESIRLAIRKNARKRAETEHTWYCRFKKAFDILGIKLDE